ncbi:MAG TPA: MobF family relaxase [Nonomuraea sp.]|nr:MobF family relaxase [Nonomuraea sp.]
MVVSVHMLGPGPDPAGYYLAQQAGCAADYYLGAEPAGRWLGAGAQAAGLNGWVDHTGAGMLRDLLAGRPPGGMPAPTMVRADPRGRLDAKPLVDAVRASNADQGQPVTAVFTDPADRAAFTGIAARVDRRERAGRGRAPTVSPARAQKIAAAAGIDVRAIYRGPDGRDRYAEAARYAGRRVDVRRPGIDVTVSAPKSVSVLYALADPTVAAQVRAAHQTAVGEVLGYLESVAGHGLRGHQGDGQRATHIGTDGWIAAAFEHHTSRAGDPQLHTHLVVPNLLHGADGRWSAVDAKAIYRHALTGSYLYHAVLRGELTARLGVEWTTPVKGIAEVAGLPRDLLSTFSIRRRQILDAMAEAGTSGPDAAQAACLATRPVKPATEPEQTLRERWAAKARAAGHRPATLVAAVLGRTRSPAAPPIDRLAQHLLGPAGLTAQATGFDRRDLLQALCQALPPGTAVDRVALEAAADRVLRHRDTVRLATRGEGGARWSTTELLGVEQAAIRTARELLALPARPVPREAIEAALSGQTMSGKQQTMVHALAAADGLAVVVGPAGAGKTAALAAATRAWTDQGRLVIGAAVAAVTARRLEHATGTPAMSLARLLAAARRTDPATGRPAGLPRGGVVVVDEASMVDTRTMAGLLAHTRASAGTLVLVGDPAQLPEVGAGGLFPALARHRDTITLTDNRRQTQGWERRALSDLRAGDPDAAVAAYATHGRVHTGPADQLPERIVGDYLRLLGDGEQPDGDADAGRVVMLAVRRADVTDLNDATRARLLADGRLGPDAVTAGQGDAQREYRAGDRVLVTRNDHRLGLLNGTRATVTAVNPKRRTLTLAAEDNQQVTVPADWAARHLDHGYAMTCHKAQGATVETALLYGAGALTREAGYVALSRGRVANHLYVPDDPDVRENGATSRVQDARQLDRLAARLAVRRTQTLATLQLPRLRPGRWQSSVTHVPEYRHVEGRSL